MNGTAPLTDLLMDELVLWIERM